MRVFISVFYKKLYIFKFFEEFHNNLNVFILVCVLYHFNSLLHVVLFYISNLLIIYVKILLLVKGDDGLSVS